MDGNIRRQTADTNIDGNDVHVTNTDENTFDDTIRGNKYLHLLESPQLYEKCSTVPDP